MKFFVTSLGVFAFVAVVSLQANAKSSDFHVGKSYERRIADNSRGRITNARSQNANDTTPTAEKQNSRVRFPDRISAQWQRHGKAYNVTGNVGTSGAIPGRKVIDKTVENATDKNTINTRRLIRVENFQTICGDEQIVKSNGECADRFPDD